jgi:hypothetical protein
MCSTWLSVTWTNAIFFDWLEPRTQSYPGLPDWDYVNFGYLTWEEFETHCRKNAADWPETLANFDFNRGQIFGLRRRRTTAARDRYHLELAVRTAAVDDKKPQQSRKLTFDRAGP